MAFEQGTREAFADGSLPFLVHLSGGNEADLISIFRAVKPEDWVFSTHRNHYHALLKGIHPDRLAQLIADGRSMFVFSEDHNFVTSSILAGNAAMAAGVALAIQQDGESRHVWCFVGDGAEDNGHFYEAVRFATARDLPVTFVIEDNDRQVDTDFVSRWGSSNRFPWDSPKVIRYHYKPTFPHGGAGLPPGSVRFRPEVVTAHSGV